MIYKVVAIAFAVLFAACCLAAWLKKNRRVNFIAAAACAGVVAVSAYTKVFWSVPVFIMLTGWAIFTATNFLTSAWRLKTGLAAVVMVGSCLALYPTIHDEILCSDRRASRPSSCPEGIAAMESEARAAFVTDAERGDKGVNYWILTNIRFRMVQGLDLAGGIRLVYTVDVQEAIRDKRDRYYDDLRARLTKLYGLAAGDDPTVEEMQRLSELVDVQKPRDHANTIILVFKDPADVKKHLKSEFLAPFLRELNFIPSTEGGEVKFVVRNDAETMIRDSAVGQAKETIDRRINSMGVKEPSISSRDEDIIVEIPGDPEKNKAQFDEIRDIIARTARLEFKMLDDEANFFEQFASEKELPEGLDFLVENAPIGPGRSQPNYYARLTKLKNESLDEALKRLRAWVESEAVASKIGKDHEVAYGKIYQLDEESGEHSVVGWRTYYLREKAELTGDMVRDAVAQADQTDAGVGQWHVSMNLNQRGAELFEKTTEQNVKKRFAIILDEVVESAPEIREKIGGGTARITMGAGGIEQQQQDAKKLELVLRSGALPAPISKSNEQTIGASLGQDSIDMGARAAAFGALFVFVIMLLWYRRVGMVANVAVFLNLIMQMAILAMFGASMTLPGICGLALTVGMSVDANVLINERMKEEKLAGKSSRAVVALGYDRAFSAILDGHVTNFIAGVILWQYGTGPIKGFAVTLIVGMLCNLFTGVVVTRIFFEWAVRGKRELKLHV